MPVAAEHVRDFPPEVKRSHALQQSDASCRFASG